MFNFSKSKGFLALTSFFLFLGLNGYSQPEWKNWNSLHLDLSVTKKLDLRLSHLQAFDMTGNYRKDFSQTSARIDYDLTKRFSLAAGAVLGSLSATDGANRYTLRGTYRIPLADIFTWSNSIQGEVHSANETRYRYRLLYITRLATKKRLDFLRLSPSVSYHLFYNIGGSRIQYYDQNDNPAVLQTPDGFHRGRLFLNLNSKITNNLSFSLYYMRQQEFNLFSGDYHKMNIINPTTGKTVRRFQNYNVLGTTITFDFDLYKKKSKLKKAARDTNI
jgi:hypothetical protein